MSDYDKQIAEIYREMELELIRSMKRNLGLHLAEEKEAGVKYPQWQAIKLKEMKRYERQNLDIIRRSTARIPKDVSAHMQDEFRQGSAHEIKKYKKVNKAIGISSEPVKDSFFRTDARKVTSMIDDVNNSLRTANTAVFRMANDAYREVVFKYSMFVSNGVYTEKQAYDAAVKSFLERGINCIEYKDGRRVNIADYAQMAIRTANQRAYMTGQGEFRKKLGRTLIRISQHSTSCELCRPFERQVLIDDVFSGGTQADGDYMLLSEAMAKGLYHPRCRHGSATYFPELDDKIEEKPIKDNSAAKAEKAHAENMVQKYKRLSEGSLCPENVEMYQAKLEEWQRKCDNCQIIDFDFKGNDKKFTYSKAIIEQLSREYKTRLSHVTVGADRAAGDVDISGARMRLNENSAATAFHEFAHTIANFRANKLGLTNDDTFWKEIRAIKRRYRKAVGDDTSRWISWYEYSSKGVDEFFADAFAQAKMHEYGIPLPNRFGNDLTFSQQVLDATNRFFGKTTANETVDKTAKKVIIDISEKPSPLKRSKDLKTIRLPKEEYAHVMSDIATWVTENELKKDVFAKKIGDYVYMV